MFILDDVRREIELLEKNFRLRLLLMLGDDDDDNMMNILSIFVCFFLALNVDNKKHRITRKWANHLPDDVIILNLNNSNLFDDRF